MLFLYRHLVQTFSRLAIVLVFIQAFGTDFLSSLALQAMLFLYRHLVQTFPFAYSSSLYTGFWYRRSFQFGQAMLFLYRHLVQTFQFGYSSSLYTGVWYRLSSLAICYVAFIQTFGTVFPVWLVVLVCIQAFGIDFPVCLQAMLFLYRHLVQTFQFGYSSSLYTGFFCFPVWLQVMLVLYIDFPVWLYWLLLIFLNIDILYRLSIVRYISIQFQFVYRLFTQTFFPVCLLDYVCIYIQTFGTDFPVWLQFQFVYMLLVQTFQFGYRHMLLLYRHLLQTFQFGYSSSLYTGFWYRLSFQFGYWLCCFYIDIWYRLSFLQFQFVYIVLVCILAFGIDFPVRLQTLCYLLYRHLVQTFQFRLQFQFVYWLLEQTFSSLAIGYVVFIQTFGTDFPVRLQFQFVYWLLYTSRLSFGYRLQAMLFLYRHLVQTFQFGYSSSLYTSFWYRLSFQFCYRQCCFYIDIWYRLSSLVWLQFLVCIQAFGIDIPVWSIGHVFIIQTFGTDFPVWLQFQFVYWLLVQTFQFGLQAMVYYIDIWYRLSSLAIVLVCIQAFGIDFLSSLAIGYVVFIQTFGTVIGFPVRLQFQFVYQLLQTFQFLVCIFPIGQAMLFLYRHLVQTFQFGYSSSLYTGFCHGLSFQFDYRLCCFYIDIWQRLSNSAIGLVCILAFGIDFLSSFAIGNVVLVQTFGTDFLVWLQFQFVYLLLIQTFQLGYRL